MAAIRPAGTKAYGRDSWVFVPTIADLESPTVAELTGVSTLDMSCYFYAETGKPSQTTNRVTRPKRVCDTVTFEQIGDTTYAGGDALYALNPQAAAASEGKAAYEKFPEGTTGYLVRRLGIDVDTAIAAGQFVDVFPVEFGPAMPTTTGDAEAAEVAAMQAFAITAQPAFLSEVAAA
jgi:hypothetical protein